MHADKLKKRMRAMSRSMNTTRIKKMCIYHATCVGYKKKRDWKGKEREKEKKRINKIIVWGGWGCWESSCCILVIAMYFFRSIPSSSNNNGKKIEIDFLGRMWRRRLMCYSSSFSIVRRRRRGREEEEEEEEKKRNEMNAPDTFRSLACLIQR